MLCIISLSKRILFCAVLKLNSGDVRFICLEAQTSAEKKSSFRVFFIAQISHTPGSQTQIAPGAKRELKTNMPHYDADATKAVPEPY